jgi:hypothetical protein
MGLGAMVATHGVFEWLRRSESAVDVVSDSEIEGCVERSPKAIRRFRRVAKWWYSRCRRLWLR